jgi:hypothetical protein
MLAVLVAIFFVLVALFFVAVNMLSVLILPVAIAVGRVVTFLAAVELPADVKVAIPVDVLVAAAGKFVLLMVVLAVGQSVALMVVLADKGVDLGRVFFSPMLAVFQSLPTSAIVPAAWIAISFFFC